MSVKLDKDPKKDAKSIFVAMLREELRYNLELV